MSEVNANKHRDGKRVVRPWGVSWMAACLSIVVLAGCGSSETTGAAPPAGPTGGGSGGAGGAGDPGSGPPPCDDPGGDVGPTPGARADVSGTLGSDGRTMLVFGGDTALPVCGQMPKREHAGDTWLLDAACGRWTDVAPPLAPSARARHAVTLDPTSGRAILFGGRTRDGDSGPYDLFNDVWAFDFAARTWSELATTGMPPVPRSNAAVVVVGSELVVFGGNVDDTGLDFVPLGDVFALDLVTLVWREIQGTGDVAPPNMLHALAADPSARIVYSAGGLAGGGTLAEVDALDVGTGVWTRLDVGNDTGGDTLGRFKHGLAFLPAADGVGPALVSFGGHDDGDLGNRNTVLLAPLLETSAWSAAVIGDVWNVPPNGVCDFPPEFAIVDLASPERRSGFVYAPRADGKAFVVFGGDSDCGRLNDAWWFDVVARVWTPLRESLVGLTCPRTGNPDCIALCR